MITEFISKSMAVLSNVSFVCVGKQCYDKYVCVCGVRIVGCVQYSSLLVLLLFAANVATVTSLKTLLKAQAPLNSLR